MTLHLRPSSYIRKNSPNISISAGPAKRPQFIGHFCISKQVSHSPSSTPFAHSIPFFLLLPPLYIFHSFHFSAHSTPSTFPFRFFCSFRSFHFIQFSTICTSTPSTFSITFPSTPSAPSITTVLWKQARREVRQHWFIDR